MKKGSLTKIRDHDRKAKVAYYALRVELKCRGPRRQRLRETFLGTEPQARQRLRDLCVAAESGILKSRRDAAAKRAQMTVEDLSKRWLAFEERNVGPHTLERYQQIVRLYIVPALGKIALVDLQPEHIEEALTAWRAVRRQPKRRKKATAPVEERALSQRSVKHIFDCTRSMLRWGARMNLLAENPSLAVKPPRVEPREMKVPDQSLITALIDAAADSSLRLPIVVLVGLGLRRGELLGLRWRDLDLDAGRLTVRRSLAVLGGIVRTKAPKTRSSARTLTMPAFVVAALREQRAAQGERRMNLGIGRASEDDYVFASPSRPGAPWNPDSFGKQFFDLSHRVARTKKLPRVRLHDLRHGFATLSLQSGADLKTVSHALGHTKIGVTADMYLHVTESMQEAHAARLDAALGSAVNEGLAAGAERAAALIGPKTDPRVTPILKNARQIRAKVVAPARFELASPG